MIIQFLFALACFLFALSIPIAKTQLASSLRRWAAFSFLLALLPSACFGLFREAARSRLPLTPSRVAEELLTLLIVAGVAYMALAIRKYLKQGPEKQRRIAMKQPVEPPGARPDILGILREQLRTDGDDGGE